MATEGNFGSLETAKVSLNHLLASSTNHNHPFSAIAELVDNAYDANAKTLKIDYMEKDEFQVLEFLDDGDGMSHEEALNVISFGHSDKTLEQIGRYGNGLKSGAFHLGREMLLLTKKDKIRTCMLISHQFHEDNGLTNAVFVPCPSFNDAGEAVGNPDEKKRYKMEWQIIHRYAPLGDKSITELFERIQGPSGTLVIISNLRRSTIGELTINVTIDEHDIILEGDDLPKHQSSLREYLKILYLKPKMEIILRDVPVDAKNIYEHWVAKYIEKLSVREFKDGFEITLTERKQLLAACKEQLAIAVSNLAKINTMGLPIDDLRRMTQTAEKIRSEAKGKVAKVEQETKVMEESKKAASIEMCFGVEIEDRGNNGIHFYINNRLVQWGYKDMKFFNNKYTIGISGFMNLEAHVFRPTINKQGFQCAQDFKSLVNKTNKYLFTYLSCLEQHYFPYLYDKFLHDSIPQSDDVWEKFWKDYGYSSVEGAKTLKSSQKVSQKVKEAIFKECGAWYLCQTCRMWRHDRKVQHRTSRFFQCSDVGKTCDSVYQNDDDKFVELRPSWKKYESKKQLKPSVRQPPPDVYEPRPVSTLASSAPPSGSSSVRSSSSRVQPATPAAPPPVYIDVDDNVQEIDTEELERQFYAEDNARNQENRKHAQRSFTKESRRKRNDYSDGDDDFLAEEEEVVKKKKSKPAARRVQEPEPIFDRTAYLEEKLNIFLRKFGEKPLPPGGQRDINPDEIVRRGILKTKISNDRAVRQLSDAQEQVGLLMNWLKTVPNLPIQVPSSKNETPFEQLQLVMKQVNKLNSSRSQ